jgi:protein gp37
MAKDSHIEWTHHTFNPWWGCTKVSPACLHCYAETWARRLALDVWGAHSSRRLFQDEYWQQPLKWNREAERHQIRRRVFCASMADVFEGRHELDQWRDRLWLLIGATPWLDWLLLTKRIHNARRMTPWQREWPNNVWIGATVENQRWADRRIPLLLEIPAAVRFISAEPLLGALTLESWTRAGNGGERLHWVIAGGESGNGARPTHPEWVRSLRDQCRESGIAFHFKQWGHWSPAEPANIAKKRRSLVVTDTTRRPSVLYGLGKTASGRVLDGETWDQFPR